MSIITDRITLGTAATLVVPNDNMTQEVHLHNMTKSSNEYIYLGNSSLAGTASSIHIDPGESITINIRPGDELYALSDPAGLDLGILRILKGD